MNRRVRLYFYVILLLFILSTIVLYKKIKTVHKTSFSPLNSKDYFFNPTKDLKYFYEPKAGKKISIGMNFLKQLGYKNHVMVVNNINKDGLNQLTDYPKEKPNNAFRIVTIGDSFTYGQNVNTEDNYPSQLEALLKKTCSNGTIKNFQVINLGVGGYDLRYVIERYRNKGQKYKPDLVLWFVIDNDFLRINEMLVPNLKYETQKIKDLNMPLTDSTIQHIPWQNSVRSILEQLGGEKSVLKMQKNNLNLLNRYFNGNLLMFSFKTLKEQYSEILTSFSLTRHAIFVYTQIPNIYNNHSLFLNDYHPTKEGYKVIVDDLFQYLVKNRLTPCGNN